MVLEGQTEQKLSSHLAHKLLVDYGSASGIEVLSPRPEGLNIQHVSSVIYKSPGQVEFAPTVQVGATYLALSSG